jgi:hypothetical protein
MLTGSRKIARGGRDFLQKIPSPGPPSSKTFEIGRLPLVAARLSVEETAAFPFFVVARLAERHFHSLLWPDLRTPLRHQFPSSAGREAAHTIGRITRVLCLSLFLCLHGLGSLAFSEVAERSSPAQPKMRIAIHCSQKLLQLWHGTDLFREYPIEIGKGGIHKKRGGDHKTPVGDYEISWMASRRSDSGHRIVEGRSWCKGNKFINAATGPALEKLWSDAYGGSEATVLSINYPNDKEAGKGYTGECIHIHAVKRPRGGLLSKSYGCIHMFAPDAMELYEMVKVGTPCKILP